MEKDGIGGDDVARGVTSTKGDEPKVLLEETEDDAENESYEGSDAGDEPAFVGEDTVDEPLIGSHVAKCGNLCLLVDDEHGECAYGIE